MASEIRFSEFSRLFARHGVSLTVKGSHIQMRKTIDGVVVPYTAVVHRNKVQHLYLQKARRRFKLLPEDGVSDDLFYKA